jgi:hypothetical protein
MELSKLPEKILSETTRDRSRDIGLQRSTLTTARATKSRKMKWASHLVLKGEDEYMQHFGGKYELEDIGASMRIILKHVFESRRGQCGLDLSGSPWGEIEDCSGYGVERSTT